MPDFKKVIFYLMGKNRQEEQTIIQIQIRLSYLLWEEWMINFSLRKQIIVWLQTLSGSSLSLALSNLYPTFIYSMRI